MGNKNFKICFITNRHLVKDKPMVSVVKKALEGGVDAVLLREKDLPARVLFKIAEHMRSLTREFNAKLIIHDRLDIAELVGADGIHLSADSILPDIVRARWGGLIGYSTHSVEEAKKVEDFVDYVFISPIFYTKSKPFSKPLGVEYLKNFVREIKVCVYALGGINEITVKELEGTGICGIAVMSAFFNVSDPDRLANLFLKSLEEVK